MLAVQEFAIFMNICYIHMPSVVLIYFISGIMITLNTLLARKLCHLFFPPKGSVNFVPCLCV